MITAMRRHYKKILIGIMLVVIPPLMFFGVARRNRPDDRPVEYAAVVDGVSIPMETYQRRLSQLERRYRQQFGDVWNEEMAQMLGLPKQAFDQMVDEVLIRNEVKRLGVAVSRQAVDDTLRALPEFKTDGKFDPQKYNQIIRQPGIRWDDIRGQLRAQLATNALVSNVASAARVSPTEISDEYVRRNEKAEVKYLALTSAILLNEAVVTDEDMLAYYNDNTESYRLPDQRRISYVQIPIEPSEQDMAAVKEKAAEVLEKARAGEDFAELAIQYSEGPSGPRGGDLGTFTKDKMVAEFSEAAFAMEPGGISDLVETTFGIHIIKVEEKTTSDSGEPQVRARHILFKAAASDETIGQLFSQAKSIVSESGKEDGSLELAAEAAGYEVASSDLFGAETRFLTGLGSAADIVPAAFEMEVGAVADPVRIRDTSYVVFRVDEEQPAHIQPFDDVKVRIESQLKREQAGKLVEPRIREIAEKIKSLDELEQVEPDMAKAVRTSRPFSRTETLPGIGRSPEFMDAAFTLAEGVLSDPIIISPRAAALLEVVARTDADMAQLAEQKEEIKTPLLQSKQMKLVADWQKSLRDRAVIVPNEKVAALWLAPPETEAEPAVTEDTG